jgi:hypothetical protein
MQSQRARNMDTEACERVMTENLKDFVHESSVSQIVRMRSFFSIISILSYQESYVRSSNPKAKKGRVGFAAR